MRFQALEPIMSPLRIVALSQAVQLFMHAPTWTLKDRRHSLNSCIKFPFNASRSNLDLGAKRGERHVDSGEIQGILIGTPSP